SGVHDQHIVGHIRYVAAQGKLLAQAWSDVARELVEASLENVPDIREKICQKYRLLPDSNVSHFHAVSAFYRILVQYGAFDKGTSDWNQQVGHTLLEILSARANTKRVLGYLVNLPVPGYQQLQDPRYIKYEHVLYDHMLHKLSKLVDVLWKEALALDV